MQKPISIECNGLIAMWTENCLLIINGEDSLEFYDIPDAFDIAENCDNCGLISENEKPAVEYMVNFLIKRRRK